MAKTDGKSFISLLFDNATSKEMMRVKKNFFRLFDEEYIFQIRVRPTHGPMKAQYAVIDRNDIYSVMAYRDNKAILRVSRSVSDQLQGQPLSSRDGLIFITADEDYMKFLFENTMEARFWITDERAHWCKDWVDQVLYEKRTGKPHPHPVGEFPKHKIT